MKSINVRLKDNPYKIVVGRKVLANLPDLLKRLNVGTDAVIVTNPLIRRLHGRKIEGVLKKAGIRVKVVEVKDAEASKSMAVAIKLIQDIIQYGVGRKVFVIAFGGGVVGDLAGFVAAITRRGIPLVQIPTTLLAQIDSSIGGKVAVDLPIGKNLVGAFYQPRLVLADTDFLSTLSERQLKNGLAEAIKYGVIADEALFTFIEKNFSKLLSGHPEALAFVVERCAAIKAGIVERDEKETKGLRTILNFGHTIGHAIEAAAGYDRYQHGEAVALGMRVVCRMSVLLRLFKPLDAVRVETLLSAVGLPETIQDVPLNKILSTMSFDKKFNGAKNRFVLIRGIGRVLVKTGISEVVIEKSIAACLD